MRRSQTAVLQAAMRPFEIIVIHCLFPAGEMFAELLNRQSDPFNFAIGLGVLHPRLDVKHPAVLECLLELIQSR